MNMKANISSGVGVKISLKKNFGVVNFCANTNFYIRNLFFGNIQRIS